MNLYESAITMLESAIHNMEEAAANIQEPRVGSAQVTRPVGLLQSKRTSESTEEPQLKGTARFIN